MAIEINLEPTLRDVNRTVDKVKVAVQNGINYRRDALRNGINSFKFGFFIHRMHTFTDNAAITYRNDFAYKAAQSTKRGDKFLVIENHPTHPSILMMASVYAKTQRMVEEELAEEEFRNNRYARVLSKLRKPLEATGIVKRSQNHPLQGLIVPIAKSLIVGLQGEDMRIFLEATERELAPLNIELPGIVRAKDVEQYGMEKGTDRATWERVMGAFDNNMAVGLFPEGRTDSGKRREGAVSDDDRRGLVDPAEHGFAQLLRMLTHKHNLAVVLVGSYGEHRFFDPDTKTATKQGIKAVFGLSKPPKLEVSVSLVTTSEIRERLMHSYDPEVRRIMTSGSKKDQSLLLEDSFMRLLAGNLPNGAARGIYASNYLDSPKDLVLNLR